VVHSDSPKHAYLNPMPDPRIRPRYGFDTGGEGVMLQGHRYLESPILGVQPFKCQASTSRLSEPTPLTVYRTVSQVPPPICRIEDPPRDGLKADCSETPTVQHIIYNKMGLFESVRRPATDPSDHDLTLSLPPPPPQEKHPQPTQKCLPIKTSSSPMR
jgi:hypothetical protein